MRDSLVWKSPPKSSGATYTYVDNADIAVISPTGDFALISCILYREQSAGRLSLIPSEGYALRKGTWKLNGDNSITVKSRLVYVPTRISELSLPTAETEERWVLHGRSKNRIAALIEAPKRKYQKGIKSSIPSPPGKYIPLKDLSNLSTLSRIIDQ